MPNSLVKFASRVDGNGRGKLYWGRAGVDGAPFRGNAVPALTEEEYDDRVTRVADPHNGTFRTWIEEENRKYLEVIDAILNGWAVSLFVDRWKVRVKLGGHVTTRHVVYLEWAQFYMEDGTPSRGNYGQPVEISHGPAASPLSSFQGSSV